MPSAQPEQPDQGQGEGAEEAEAGAAAPPSFATFLLSCLAASRLPPGGCSLTREMSDAARREAIAEGSPALCAGLQDLPGNMAGEGKLLNIYHLLRQTLALGIEGDVVELG